MRLYVKREAETGSSHPLGVEIDWMPGWYESQVRAASKAYSEAMEMYESD